MPFEINKPSVWIPIALTIIGMVAGSIVFAYHEFVTQEEHDGDKQAVMEELAGVSINQQAIGCRQNIKWYEQDLADFVEENGSPPYRDHKLQMKYNKILRDLEDEREFCNDVRKKQKGK